MKTRTKIFLGIGIVVAISATIVLIYASKKFRLKNKKPRKILFVGDSQSAIRTEGGDSISYTFPNLVKAQLEPKGYTIDVLAIVGKQTSWMKENLPAQLAQKKYDRVYIYGGGNDVSSGKSVDSVLTNIQEMVTMVNNSGADAFVNLGYRIDNFADPYKMPKTIYVPTPEQWIPIIEKRKQLQKALPKSIKGANFVPIYDLKGLTNDGIHPTAEGHKIVAENILKTIA
jgi:lysophospholipase L1-like esterase